MTWGGGRIGFRNPIIVAATILGDIVALDWNADIPPAAFPAAATAGYYLRSSEGIAQFAGPVYAGDDQNYVALIPIVAGAATTQYFIAGVLAGYLAALPGGLILQSFDTLGIGVFNNLNLLVGGDTTISTADLTVDTSDILINAGPVSGNSVTINTDTDVTLTADRTIIDGFLNLPDGGTLTIAGGAVTATHSHHRIDTQGGAANDNLTTINGGDTDDILIIQSQTSARDVTVIDNNSPGGDNIVLQSASLILDSSSDRLVLLKSGPNWFELLRSSL